MPHGWGALRVLCVSYAWLQPDHPDPKAHTLSLLDTFAEDGTFWMGWDEFQAGAHTLHCTPASHAKQLT